MKQNLFMHQKKITYNNTLLTFINYYNIIISQHITIKMIDTLNDRNKKKSK